jgi:hypothetical protein
MRAENKRANTQARKKLEVKIQKEKLCGGGKAAGKITYNKPLT